MRKETTVRVRKVDGILDFTNVILNTYTGVIELIDSDCRSMPIGQYLSNLSAVCVRNGNNENMWKAPTFGNFVKAIENA